jgi:hypothetical protein
MKRIVVLKDAVVHKYGREKNPWWLKEKERNNSEPLSLS